MRLITSLLPLLPLAIAAPANVNAAIKEQRAAIPEMTLSEWSGIQSTFVDGVRSLGSWSWTTAEEIVSELSDELKVTMTDDGGGPEQTIWQQLKGDPHSFSKLVKLIEFEGHASKILDDPKAQITFFAPNNDALTPPHHHHDDHDGDDDEDSLTALMRRPSLSALSAIIESDPSLTATGTDDDHHGHDHHPGHHPDHPGHGHGGDDKDKKRRKEIFRYIAGVILRYHGLTNPHTVQELAENSTWPTALRGNDGANGGLAQRVRVEKTLVPPAVHLNFYATLLVTDIKAKNGLFHTLKYPLLPPASLLDEYFLFPEEFAILTSSIQRLHASKYYEWSYDREHSKPGHPVFYGTGLGTNFAPDNKAFAALPEGLKRFLFSPFGHEVLAKILMYHYVPHTLLLSELIHVEKTGGGHKHGHKHGHQYDEVEVEEVNPDVMFQLGDDPSFHKEIEVPTALPNATLKVVIDKKKVLPIEGAVKINIKVNDKDVRVYDVPAHNGATHVISEVLIPPHKHHDHDGEDIASEDTWNNWEEWLPAWAAEQ